MPTNKTLFNITGGPSMLEMYLSLFDRQEGYCDENLRNSRDSVIFHTEKHVPVFDGMPPQKIDFEGYMKSLQRINGGIQNWKFKAIIFSLDTVKEIQGEYDCRRRNGTIISVSEIISNAAFELPETGFMRIVAGPDKYEFVTTLIRGDALNQRTLNFQLKENDIADIYGWDARIISIERSGTASETWFIEASMDRGDNNPVYGRGYYSPENKSEPGKMFLRQ